MKKAVRYLIWATLYQVAFMKKAAHHVVKEAVDYAKTEHGIHIGGFVNAVLRRFLRDAEKASFPLPRVTGRTGLSPEIDMAIVYSFPEWLVRRWAKRFGLSRAEKILQSLTGPPEFTVRVDERRVTLDAVIDRLETLNLTVKPGIFLKPALHIDRLAPLIHDDLFTGKLVSIQDEASQLAVHALQLRRGNVVLDACSGLGTKASNILSMCEGIRLVSVDNNMRRLRYSDRRACVVLGDVLHAPFKKEIFDAILLDAPCSSLGIVRKHPEIKWRRKEREIDAFGAQQYRMLIAVWELLKTGGHLVYSVCSFEPEETQAILTKFGRYRKFALENPLPFLFNKECFVSLPHETGIDGFFIARLKKL